jgi:tRNA A-37 threonylcarbamoyl transferase component Bud32
MAPLVYTLSALISLASAVLLFRSYAQTRTGLLLWAGLCFVGLTLNNVMLFVDKVVVMDVDLSAWRALPALLGTLLMVYGLVMEATRT